MSNFSAFIPTANLAAANAALEEQGFGPGNFSVPVYDGPTATGAMFHCWADPVFQAAVEMLPGVVLTFPDTLPEPTTEPTALVIHGATEQGHAWGGDAKPLTGNVTPGLHKDADGALWWVIQAYNTDVYPDPAAIPALIRMAKIPGEALPWVQPLDQFDAYKLANPFTGQPDRCTHNGKTWKVTQADGAGNNTWEPGTFGWVDENAAAQPAAWVQPTGVHDAYQIGAEVTHNGSVWVSTAANNVWSPGDYGWQIK